MSETNPTIVTAEPSKPKSKKGCCLLFPAVILLCAGLYAVNKVHTISQSTADGPAGPSKNYTYPLPSAEAVNRVIDCNQIRTYKANPRNVLCLNLYRTNPDEIRTKLQNTVFDTVVLYGQTVIFDTALTINKPKDFESRIYNFARFTDLITLPRLLGLYGITDLNYINSDFAPYPALYIQVRNQVDVNDTCGSTYNIGGCSFYHFLIVIKDSAISEDQQYAKWKSLNRNETDDHLFYRETIPQDCYVSYILLHEAAHSLIFAREMSIEGMSLVGNMNRVPKWFNEEQAGMTSIMGLQWVCGADIIGEKSGTFTKKVNNPGFLDFQAIYPSNLIAGGSPDNDCQKALLTSFYRYLADGAIEERMPTIMSDIREKSKIQDYLSIDTNFANLLLKYFEDDTEIKNFLKEKDCGI